MLLRSLLPALLALQLHSCTASSWFVATTSQPAACPSTVESVLSGPQYSECLRDISPQGSIFRQDAHESVCQSHACLLALDALYLYKELATPFDECVLADRQVIKASEVKRLIESCERRRRALRGEPVRELSTSDATSQGGQATIPAAIVGAMAALAVNL